jgi:hypothetical protein
MTTRNERREQNQRDFQSANQRFHDAVENRIQSATVVPFLCECADEECRAKVEVSPEQWEAVAERPNHFLITAGHPRTEGEEIVDTLGPYEIVEKPGD